MEHIPMCINGEWIFGGKDIQVCNPSTGKPLVTISNATPEQIDQAVDNANRAFESEEWRKFKPFERGQLLVKLAQYIRTHAEQWAELESLDVGKPMTQARADVEAAARYFEFYGGAADKVMGETIPIEDGLLNAVVLEPVGVTVHIVPWNYPIQITSRSVAAAIATGNAVIIKSAEDTPLSTHEMVKWLKDRLPKGIIQHITGYGRDVGAYLSSHPDIHHITFTGSVPTGISVMQAAAQNVVPVTLELGGKSPNIVFKDADEKQALEGVMRAIVQNAGQTCSAGARLLIERSYKDAFLTKLVTLFEKIRIGAGEQDLDMGPLLNETQFKKITSLLELAARDGQVLTGGKTLQIEGYPEGYYVAPTIVDGLDVAHPLALEEIFGPVLIVFTFETVAEAISMANATPYGLVAGIWTSNLNTAHYVASRVKAGQVFINNYGAAGGIQMPFGGYKKSGIGREKGLVALRNYTQMKNIAIRYTDREVTDMHEDNDLVLKVDHLSICFDLPDGQQAKVVEDVSFSVYKGETLALVGESGSGKSITSLAVMRLLPTPPGRITSGMIQLNGQDLLQMKLKDMSAIRGNEISMIFQEPMTSLDPVFKVSNQLIEGIRRHQKVSQKEAFDIALGMLKEVGIANAEKIMHEYPHQLSGGMRQRVMIAMAMANHPKLLIADEPTTALDVTVQAQILRLMLKMKEEHGSAILFITHDLGVVAETAERVMVMYAGQIVEEAPVKTLFTEPKHPYTVALLKTIPSLDTNVHRLPSIPGTVPSASKLPNGCRFAARCEHAMPVCSEKQPTIMEFENRQKVRCHLYTEKGVMANVE